MDDDGASKILAKPSRIPQPVQPPARTSPSKTQTQTAAGARKPATVTLIPRPASPGHGPAQKPAADRSRLRSSSEVPSMPNQRHALGQKTPSILQKVAPLDFSSLSKACGASLHARGQQLEEPVACASPPRSSPRGADEQGTSCSTAHIVVMQQMSPEHRTNSGASMTSSPVRSSAPAARRSLTASQLRNSDTLSPAHSRVANSEDSPSPGMARKSFSRLQAEGMAPRRASSVDKTCDKATNPMPVETRASFLRRSASADKRQGMQSNSQTAAVKATPAPATAARTTATGVRASIGATTTTTTQQRMPHPPSESRTLKEPGPAARHRMLGSPTGPSKATPTPSSAIRGMSASPTRRSSAGGMASTPTIKAAAGGQSILQTIAERKQTPVVTPVTTPHGQASLAANNHRTSLPHGPRLSLGVQSLAASKPASPKTSIAARAALRSAPQPATTPLLTPEPAPNVAPPALGSVPRLNLSTCIVEESVGNVYAVAPEEPSSPKAKKSGSGSGPKKTTPPSPPPDHFYFYPRVDPADERKTLEQLSKLPKSMQKPFKKIWSESIQAKQNCEAIAFRGHRLLDQMNSHHKERDKQQAAQIIQLNEAYEQAQREIQHMRQLLLSQQGGGALAGATFGGMEPGGMRAAGINSVAASIAYGHTGPALCESGAWPAGSDSSSPREHGAAASPSGDNPQRSHMAPPSNPLHRAATPPRSPSPAEQEVIATVARHLDECQHNLDIAQRSVRLSQGGGTYRRDAHTPQQLTPTPPPARTLVVSDAFAPAARVIPLTPIPPSPRTSTASLHLGPAMLGPDEPTTLQALRQSMRARAGHEMALAAGADVGIDGGLDVRAAAAAPVRPARVVPLVPKLAIGSLGLSKVAPTIVQEDVEDAQDQDDGLGGLMEQMRKGMRMGRATDDLVPQQDIP